MKQRTLFRKRMAAGLVAALGWTVAVQGADWITAPSYFTHDPQTGQRVTQYSPIGPFYTYPDPTFQRSGYRHTRSSIQVGGSADNMHIVEEWGRAVRPYGEWRFPYRPYSVPYSLWGPPFAGLGYPYPPYGMPYAAPNAQPGGGGYGQGPYGAQNPPPYYDGSYPQYRSRQRPIAPPHRGRLPRSPGHGGRPGTGGPSGPAPGPTPHATGGSA